MIIKREGYYIVPLSVESGTPNDTPGNSPHITGYLGRVYLSYDNLESKIRQHIEMFQRMRTGDWGPKPEYPNIVRPNTNARAKSKFLQKEQT